MIDDTPEEIPKRHQFLRETVPFGLIYRIDKRVRAEMPFERFKDRVIEGYKPTLLRGELESLEIPADKLPDNEIFRHLHHLAIEAHIARQWWREAQAMAKTSAWKDHMKFVKGVINLTDNAVPLLTTVDSFLSARDVRALKLSARIIKLLRDRFRETRHWDERLKDVKGDRNWNATLRQAQNRMDQTLQEKCRTLNKTQRLELITLATTVSGLTKHGTFDAVARKLSPDRARQQRRRR
jgi:hypothetical protein